MRMIFGKGTSWLAFCIVIIILVVKEIIFSASIIWSAFLMIMLYLIIHDIIRVLISVFVDALNKANQDHHERISEAVDNLETTLDIPIKKLRKYTKER